MKHNNRQGQSLIEVLVALSVLTGSFLGILSLLSRSFLLNRVTSDQAKATYLAEEGIELAKNLIDHDVYRGLATGGVSGGWGVCFPFAAGTNDYEIDYTTENCPPAGYTGRFLNFDNASGLYGYAAGAATDFVRRIRITKPVGQPNVISVESTVSWSTGPVTSQNIDLQDNFYHWH